MLGNIPDNVWAFLLFILAAVVALIGAHTGSKDLLNFASTVAMTGAALFHGKNDKPPAS